MCCCGECLKQAKRPMTKKMYSETEVGIDVTHLEGEGRCGKRRAVVVEIQHFDLKLADTFFGRPTLVFGRHRQPIEGSFFMIQRDFGSNDSRWFINRERIQSICILAWRIMIIPLHGILSLYNHLSLFGQIDSFWDEWQYRLWLVLPMTKE